MHPIRLSGNGQLVSDKVSKLKKNKSSSSNLTSWQLWESLWQAAFYAIGRFAVCVQDPCEVQDPLAEASEVQDSSAEAFEVPDPSAEASQVKEPSAEAFEVQNP